MSVEVKKIGDVFILRLEETFDMYSAPAVRESLIKFMTRLDTEQSKKGVLFDFGNVSYIDSSAIGVIAFFYNQCMKRSLTCVFVSLGSQAKKVLSLTGLRYPIYDTVEEGVKILTSNE
jgi:anti-anti-sigma factor